MAFDFFGGSPTVEVMAEHFVGSFVRFYADPEADEQRGDDRQVDLQFDAGRFLAQQVSAPQDALQPAEEQFDLPTMSIGDGDQFRRERVSIRRQDPGLSGLSTFNFDHA